MKEGLNDFMEVRLQITIIRIQQKQTCTLNFHIPGFNPNSGNLATFGRL